MLEHCSLEPHVYGTCAGVLALTCSLAAVLLKRYKRRPHVIKGHLQDGRSVGRAGYVFTTALWLWNRLVKVFRRSTPAVEPVVVMETPEMAPPICLDGLNICDDEKISSLTPCTPHKSWFKSLEDIQFDVDSSPEPSPVSDPFQHGMGTGKHPLIRPAKLKVPSFNVSMATANMSLSDGCGLSPNEHFSIKYNNPFRTTNNPSTTKRLPFNPLNTVSAKSDDVKSTVAASNKSGRSRRPWTVLLVAMVIASLCCNVVLLSVLGVNMYNTYR